MDLGFWIFFLGVLFLMCSLYFTFMLVLSTDFNHILFLNITLTLWLNSLGKFWNSRHTSPWQIYNRTWGKVRGGIKEENWGYRTYKEAIQATIWNPVFIQLIFTEDLLPAKTQRQPGTVYKFWRRCLKTLQNKCDPHHQRQGKWMLLLTKRYFTEAQSPFLQIQWKYREFVS